MENYSNYAPASTSKGFRPMRALCTLFFGLALFGIAVLIVTDASRHFAYASIHQKIGAFPLIFIGLAYIFQQLSIKRSTQELVKGILLGLAFVLWGSEQLMTPSLLVTIMDSAVVTIFVIDLSYIIADHLKRKDHDLP